MSKKSKRYGGSGSPATVHIDGHPHKQYSLETKSTFITKHVLTPQEMAEIQEAAQKGHIQAVTNWLTAKLNAVVTGDVKEFIEAMAPATGRLNS